VSYSGSTPVLDDKKKYPNILRVHPSVTRENKNVVNVLDKLNEDKRAKINSVVLMHTNSLYGSTSAQVTVTFIDALILYTVLLYIAYLNYI